MSPGVMADICTAGATRLAARAAPLKLKAADERASMTVLV
jgi:hypothetical protein